MHLHRGHIRKPSTSTEPAEYLSTPHYPKAVIFPTPTPSVYPHGLSTGAQPPRHRPGHRRNHAIGPSRRLLRHTRHGRRAVRARPRHTAARTVTQHRQTPPQSTTSTTRQPPWPGRVERTLHLDGRRPAPDDAADESVESQVHLDVDHVRAAGARALLAAGRGRDGVVVVRLHLGGVG